MYLFVHVLLLGNLVSNVELLRQALKSLCMAGFGSSVILRTPYMGVCKNQGSFFGVPAIRIMVYWGLFWGPLFMEPSYELSPQKPHPELPKSLITEYTLNHSWNPCIIVCFMAYSLIQDFWKLWEERAGQSRQPWSDSRQLTEMCLSCERSRCQGSEHGPYAAVA